MVSPPKLNFDVPPFVVVEVTEFTLLFLGNFVLLLFAAFKPFSSLSLLVLFTGDVALLILRSTTDGSVGVMSKTLEEEVLNGFNEPGFEAGIVLLSNGFFMLKSTGSA